MRIVLTQGVTGGTLRVSLHHNDIYGNQIGLLATSLNSSGNTLIIDSTGDRFADNRAGCQVMAGFGATAGSNTLLFTATGDVFEDNNAPQLLAGYTLGGGIVGIGGTQQASGNSAFLQITGSRFSGNAIADVSVFGAYSNLGVAAGTDNDLHLTLTGIKPGAVISTLASDPPDPGNTNTVILKRRGPE